VAAPRAVAAVPDDFTELRRRLAARHDRCLERLEDVVSELYSVHSVPADEILALAQAAIDKEQHYSRQEQHPPETPLRFLIVDDRPDARELVRLVLERRGYIVVGEAANREEALAAAAGSEPDAVLVDLRLGAESGLELARALTTTRPQLPVLMVSVDSTATPELVRAYGARGFVVKTRLDEVDLPALLELDRTP
jgi:CheY-like chemotaxis protein